MPTVADFTQPDWEWLRRVLGTGRADDPEYPDRTDVAIALRDAGMPEDAIRAWTDAVDEHPNRYNVFMDGVVDRILDLHQRHVTPADGAQWLWENTPITFVPQLIAAERTTDDYYAFTAAAWDDQQRFPREGDASPEGLFLIRWLLCSTFPLDEALAYTHAGVLPNEAVTTWEPIRQTDPNQWDTTLRFMAAMPVNPEEDPS